MTMKLYFLRHGLADRSAWNGSDFERPLTPYGKERMAREADSIAKLNLGLDAIISSPLVRAHQTAEIVAERLDLLEALIVDERLSPGFGIGDVAEILEEHPEAENLMFVGHEPDFSYTIERLVGGGSIECKKGSLARVDLVDAGPLSGVLVWLVPPKILA
jgi:phosphohistidine phosphatase